MNKSKIPNGPHTLHSLQRDYPWIEWDKPQPITVGGGPKHYACRICIANQGIKADEVTHLPLVPGLIARHIRDEH